MCAVVAATRAFARSMIRGEADVGGRRAEEECRTRSSFDRFLLRLRLSFVDDARFTISACLLIQARLVRTTMVGTTDCWRSGLPSAAHGAASAGCAASRVRSSRSHADNARGSTRDALLARQGRRPSTPPFDDAARSTTGRDRPSRASSAGGPARAVPPDPTASAWGGTTSARRRRPSVRSARAASARVARNRSSRPSFRGRRTAARARRSASSASGPCTRTISRSTVAISPRRRRRRPRRRGPRREGGRREFALSQSRRA